MFEHFLSDTDRAIIHKAKDFAAGSISEQAVSRWYQDGGIPDSVMLSYQNSGLGSLGLPPRYGGSDVSVLAQVQIVEELSRSAGATLPLQSQLYSLNIISLFDDPPQLAMISDQLKATGRACFSLATAQAPADSDLPNGPAVVSERDGRLILSGQKSFVSDGQHAPYILVAAQNQDEHDEQGRAVLSAWLVPLHSEGVQTFAINKLGQKMISSAVVVFNDVALKASWQVGAGDTIRPALERAGDLEHCLICANSLGMAEAAYDDAAQRVAARTAHNHQSADFQQTAMKLADMATRIFHIKAHVYQSAAALQSKKASPLEIALMRRYVPEAAVRVADDAMQIFDAAGYTDQVRASRIWLDCRGNRSAADSEQSMTALAAREVIGRYR
ncbi:MAG: acyl-CoA dehydrogenase family protein [Coriobacteriales bacterium]|nr:acyl-CoA dehydrogenase family protein [Coriobacteriales bacterium]